MDLFLCLIILKLSYIFQSHATICLTWTLRANVLRLKCQTSNIRAKISFFDPQNREQGYCDIPYPTPQCINHKYYKNSTIIQNVYSKETVFEIKENFDFNVIGNWHCDHGKKLEVAATNVHAFNKIDFSKSSFYIQLSGPDYVRTNTPVWLTCVSHVQLMTKSVKFYLNDIVHTTITTNKYGCYSTFAGGLCKPDECQCLKDGKTFFIKHIGFQNDGIFSVKCTFEFELAFEMSDCILVNVVDIEGPRIMHNKPLPFLALDYVELRCIALINDTNIQLTWECFDLKPDNSFQNMTVVDSVLAFKVLSSMNEKTCVCKAMIQTFEMVTSIKIKVTTAPILAIDKHIICNESTGIIVSCIGRGKLPVVGFRAWFHSYNGQFIRYLKGTKNGNTSTINLNCNYENEGEYVCSAWSNENGIQQSNNVSDKLIIQGPPQITERYVKTDHDGYEISLHIYSVPSPINTHWFKGKEKLSNSTQYLQTVARILTHRRMYGTDITTYGYSLKLTIKTNSADQRKQTYSVLVNNSIGNFTEYFVTEEKDINFHQGLNYQDVLIVSGTIILFAVIVLLIILFVRSGKINIGRTSNLEMYQPSRQNESNIHEYDVPSHYEEVISIPNEASVINQPSEQNQANKINTNDPEEEYEIPHDYMEVF